MEREKEKKKKKKLSENVESRVRLPCLLRH